MNSQILKMSPNWSETLDQFKVDDVHQFEVSKSEMAKARAIINRLGKKSEKFFVTNSLLKGGFEIKRTK